MKSYYCTSMRNGLTFLILITIGVGCAPIQKSIIELEQKQQYHAGFYLYDPVNNKELINTNGDKYFTPASNTKVYTLFASQLVLPDSMPAFKYVQSDTALHIWGLSDPSFLNPDLPQGNVYDFLLKAPKIYISQANFYSERFGAGWAWDDYHYNFNQERSAFPIYGNSVVFNKDSLSNQLQVMPSLFTDSVTVQPADQYTIKRSEFSNEFTWDTTACNNCKRISPIFFSNPTLVKLLEDTLKTRVFLNEQPIPNEVKTFYSIPTDTVLKTMMQRSDNFLAEHLLLSVAAQLSDSLSTEVALEQIGRELNSFLPDTVVWRDGSGLSRYNLFTPRNMVFLWDALYKQMGEKRLFSLISIGGEVGTLKNYFKADPPYIYGKTGTLSNIFNLSGFLITKSGKRLIFGYMNNDFRISSRELKYEMDTILKEIYEKY